MCAHAKVGLSTWTYHFRDLLPAKIFRNLSQQINITAEDVLWEWSKAMDSYYAVPPITVSGNLTNMLSPYYINNFLTSNQILSFSFVRHPFERLVSAYQNKFNGTNSYYPREYEWWFKGKRSFSSFIDLVLYQLIRNTVCY